MAQFKLVRVWQNNVSDIDYAAYYFMKENNVTSVKVRNGAWTINKQEMSELSRYMQTRVINIDCIREIYCTKIELKYLDEDKPLVFSPLSSYDSEQGINSVEVLRYYVIMSLDADGHVFTVSPDDVKEILGVDWFEELSKNPI